MNKYIINIEEYKDGFTAIYGTDKFGEIGFCVSREKFKNNEEVLNKIKKIMIKALFYVDKYNLKTSLEYENFIKSAKNLNTINEYDLKTVENKIEFLSVYSMPLRGEVGAKASKKLDEITEKHGITVRFSEKGGPLKTIFDRGKRVNYL